jgi:SAM-dependent methyltransferase
MNAFWTRPNLDTFKYGVRCVRWRLDPALMRCPSCGSANTTGIARKAWITDLVRCEGCRLLYRRPQEPLGFAQRFYQQEYRSGLTTQLPEKVDLARMLASRFKDCDKDLGRKIDVLRMLGLPAGARILDYGSSWGYGVWQMNAAGYHAEGFELSRTRACQGSRYLGVTIHTERARLPENAYDAVFTNHVLEHIPNTREAFDTIASVLKTGGWLVAFFPNGSDECRRARPTRFHRNWGRLHPIYLNREHCARLLDPRPYWMMGKPYAAPPDLALLKQWNRTSPWVGDMKENEMMLVARF